MLPLFASAQETFTCPEIKEDIKKFDSVRDEYPYSTKLRARAELKLFPLNIDGAIENTYILHTEKTISEDDLRDACEKWFSISFLNARNVIQESTNEYIRANGVYANMASYVGFASATYINSPVSINIYFKPGKIKFEISVQHYTMGSANGFGSSESRISVISDCYPSKSDSDHKESYSMAYLNTLHKNISEADSFYSFLNKHFSGPVSSKSEDW